MRLENKATASEVLQKTGKWNIWCFNFWTVQLARSDIDEILDRLNKMDNNSKMRDVMSGGAMSDNSVDLILKAIDDMQSKIKSDFDEKLKNFVTIPDFREVADGLNAMNRRVIHNEGLLADSERKIQ